MDWKEHLTEDIGFVMTPELVWNYLFDVIDLLCEVPQ